MLTLVFGFAEEQELITKNPMDKVECPKLQKKKVDALTQEQAQQFFSLLPSVPLDFRCMLYLFITTGLRRGELLGLQWGDMDFDNLTIEIKRNVTYTKRNGIVVDIAKNGKQREDYSSSARCGGITQKIQAGVLSVQSWQCFCVPKRKKR